MDFACECEPVTDVVKSNQISENVGLKGKEGRNLLKVKWNIKLHTNLYIHLYSFLYQL